MYVCICAGVPDVEVRSCIARGARTVEEVGDACGAGTGCGSCHEQHRRLPGRPRTAPSEIGGLPLSA